MGQIMNKGIHQFLPSLQDFTDFGLKLYLPSWYVNSAAAESDPDTHEDIRPTNKVGNYDISLNDYGTDTTELRDIPSLAASDLEKSPQQN
ncbi:hypothetical protein C5167_043045 [Papaver somniferum]|uniref:Uncharacterized protein n=1 Tax=Papaver somniferum TaxID=3469 RepID=A0A4Y7L5L1_PAPSO|nr:hypothetical protein C5167_043045 [Papaver somniferum]